MIKRSLLEEDVPQDSVPQAQDCEEIVNTRPTSKRPVQTENRGEVKRYKRPVGVTEVSNTNEDVYVTLRSPLSEYSQPCS